MGAPFCSKAIRLFGSSAFSIGTPREIYNLPLNAFVADFIGETNFLKGKLKSKDGGEFVVDSSLGEVRSDLIDRDFAVGDPLLCSVRPESISISDNPVENVPNQFEAVISSAIYLGDVEEYWLRAKDSLEIKVVLHNPGQYERRAGDKVYISFQPQDAVSLPDEGDKFT